MNWDASSGDQKIALLKAAAAETRQAKEAAPSDFTVWHDQAVDANYRHRSVLGPGREQASTTDRIDTAYRAAMPMIEDEFKRRAVLDGQELREIAARWLIVAGVGKDVGVDIDAVLDAFRERGVMQDGHQVKLLWGSSPTVRGKERETVTTSLHADQERELIRLGEDRCGR